MAARKNYIVSVPTSGLNVREKPHKSAKVTQVIPNGDRVAVITDTDAPIGWIALQGGGYVMAEFLKPLQSARAKKATSMDSESDIEY